MISLSVAALWASCPPYRKIVLLYLQRRLERSGRSAADGWNWRPRRPE